MNKNTITTIILILFAQLTFSQITFTDTSSSLINSNLKSGVSLAIVDMNNDGLDDIIRRNSNNNLEIEYQTVSGVFQKLELGFMGGLWGMSIADVDKNGFNDIIGGGNFNGVKLFLANADATDYTISSLNGPGIFVQNTNFADIDNDGNIDFFSCHDVGISAPYKNDGFGNFNYDLSLINAESTVVSDNSGNYGSIWADYDNDGDLDMYLSKCRLGVDDVNDGRRLNLLFQNDGNGNYTDVAQASGLLPFAQTWATTFEDIDNDGDLDAIMINHEPVVSQIYENNGDGTFTDITVNSGILTELQNMTFGIQVVMEDFNNDTFIDILMTSTFSSANHFLFLNNGDKTFTSAPNAFNTNGNIMQSAVSGDLNNDGFIDIVAAYADSFNSPSSVPDQLFLNDGNTNNWSEIMLTGVTSNRNGIGARVEIFGAWGKQIREVRAGESYGTQNSFLTHFGLGTETNIDKIRIIWPTGIIDEINNPNSNEKLTFIEGQNILSLNSEVLSESFNIYPNVAANFVTVNTNFKDNTVVLTIYNITGKQVFQQNIIGFGNETINIENLNAGMYFVKANNKTLKLIKK